MILCCSVPWSAVSMHVSVAQLHECVHRCWRCTSVRLGAIPATAAAQPDLVLRLLAAGTDLINSLTLTALVLLYGGAVLAVWSLFTYLKGTWVHFRWACLDHCKAAVVAADLLLCEADVSIFRLRSYKEIESLHPHVAGWDQELIVQ